MGLGWATVQYNIRYSKVDAPTIKEWLVAHAVAIAAVVVFAGILAAFVQLLLALPLGIARPAFWGGLETLLVSVVVLVVWRHTKGVPKAEGRLLSLVALRTATALVRLHVAGAVVVVSVYLGFIAPPALVNFVDVFGWVGEKALEWIGAVGGWLGWMLGVGIAWKHLLSGSLRAPSVEWWPAPRP